MKTLLNERVSMSDTANHIYAFRVNGDIHFYNHSLFRWLTVGGEIRGSVKISHNKNTTVFTGVLPESVFISKLNSGKFGEWNTNSWGYLNIDLLRLE